MERGYVQVYTGNGKGKTTAAFGLAIRAVGDGMKVYIVQFLKTSPTGEVEAIKKLADNIKVFRFEKKRGFFWTLNDEEKTELKKEVQKAYEFVQQVIENEKCDILILDEIMGAITNKLLTETQVLELIEKKPLTMELVLTGRNVPEAIAKKADLITEMKDIKHYMNEGVTARKGVEY
ncbi:Cob(I)yrinic acid a,c-diamide adenosyltransferase [Clostridium oryzae]|uniref:Cob(I)yrinic acid a,c-diamide adenosyltransferase n=2 Tax=Clostridium oryzae TaxID=1450648 RepID=A0A1V4IT23_9CLOT|nr:Cob(I)yrinic acid a,c-diamide adenosyltransferase [Clostridium oryzae]